jgi:hypothetical protein
MSLLVEQFGSYLTDFRDIGDVKICRENSGLVKIGQKYLALRLKNGLRS